MSWFRNRYVCARCGSEWFDEWSCMCEDDCPHCSARHMSPSDSQDLTTIITPQGDEFVVLRSPDSAGHDPDYREVAAFRTRRQARSFVDRTVPWLMT